MTKATYQTKAPSSLIKYCEAMGLLLGKVKRHLYTALEQGEKLSNLKREYQIRFGMNARQFNSVHSSIKGKIESRKECHKRQINEFTDRIKGFDSSLAISIANHGRYQKTKKPRLVDFSNFPVNVPVAEMCQFV